VASFEIFDAPPEVAAAQVRLRAEIAAQSFWLAGAKLALLAAKDGFNPAQPRVPAGCTGGRQWCPAGGGGGTAKLPQTKRPKRTGTRHEPPKILHPIGPVGDFPETGKNDWRRWNDDVFTNAATNSMPPMNFRLRTRGM